jgi:pyrimidine-nucleoside phosphorylase
LLLGEKAKSLDEARKMAEKSLADGSALEKLKVLVSAQGGDVTYIDDISKFERAQIVEVVKASRNGNISQVHARSVGEAAVILGAGRAKKSDAIDHAVGILIHKKVGDVIKTDEPLFTIYANDKNKLAEAREMIVSAFQIRDESVPPLPLFYE